MRNWIEKAVVQLVLHYRGMGPFCSIFYIVCRNFVVNRGLGKRKTSQTLCLRGYWWRRRWDSNPRISCPINAFRVRPVMTTSIRLRSRYIIATFKMVSKKDLALHNLSCFLALEVLNDRKTEGYRGSHCLAGDDVAACDDLSFFVKICTLFGHDAPDARI